MTAQIPDEVRFHGILYAITAIDGAGLFHPADHGITPGPLSTGCWHGFHCRYRIERDLLLLNEVEIGQPPENEPAGRLFGVSAVIGDALRYRRLAWRTPFTGRLLLGADHVNIGYLNMGFTPAWLFRHVYEVNIDAGRLTKVRDRSSALAEVRRQVGADGLGPAPGEPTAEWIHRAFSLTFDYSWPKAGAIAARRAGRLRTAAARKASRSGRPPAGP